MVLDRTIAPEFQVITSIHLPQPEVFRLQNGMSCYAVNIGQQPIVKVEILFEAGAWQEQTQGASLFTIKMLPEGTASHDSAAINAVLERMGAFTEMSHSLDRSGIVVYCLSRYLPAILPLVQELMTSATFPEKEWQNLKNITLQGLRVNLEKTAYRAGALFRAELFGEEHPYGRVQSEETIEALTTSDAMAHYDRTIRKRPFTVLLAGSFTQEALEAVDQFLGGIEVQSAEEKAVPQEQQRAPALTFIERPDSLQSSIRLGCRLFTRQHPDYFRFLVMNEVLGGYFGSRLMKNIREEKGLTYGISSSVVTLQRAGYFVVGTDVKRSNTQQTLDEIRKEIRILQTTPVPADELQTVKNFMAGEFAGSLNTAFEVADRQKILLLDQLPPDFFEQYIVQIHATTADDIMEMATTYLPLDQLTEIVVGGK